MTQTFYEGVLSDIPSHWALTPLNSDTKAPFRQGWQSEDPLSQEEILRWINVKDCHTVGVRTGEVSGGLLAVDFDGESAYGKYIELSDGNKPDPSIIIVSGVPNHMQVLYQVPQEYWGQMTKQRRSFMTSKNPLEHLEFRWRNHQSVIWGLHPSGRYYSWLYSPREYEISICPKFIIDLLSIYD